MDEATSSVDFECVGRYDSAGSIYGELIHRMDAKITQTIKECFEGTTMIVIAHRLATIMH